MKKTIRLTESELINLVQRIIKEDEMMGTSDVSSSMRPQGCRVTINDLANKNPIITNKPKNENFVVSTINGKAKTVKMIGGSPIAEEEVKPGSIINSRIRIKLNNGTTILFKPLEGFGQATLKCDNNKAELYSSTD